MELISLFYIIIAYLIIIYKWVYKLSENYPAEPYFNKNNLAVLDKKCEWLSKLLCLKILCITYKPDGRIQKCSRNGSPMDTVI